MRPAAFFDLDRTVITVNSGDLWMKRERRLGRLSLRHVAEGTALFLAYRLSVVDIEAAMRKALAIYRGEREADLRRWTREWYALEVAPCIAPRARRAMAEHRAAGHPLILLTSSSPYLSEIVAEDLGLDGWISSRYEVRDGTMTGEPVLPLCYGAGKVGHADRYAREEGIDLGRSFFYTDSYTDLPMLLAVGEPRVVNPDLRLRLYARWRGWPVLDWRRDAVD
jgi:HAD superfamily hydrolase (TIGR01490 family)